MSATAIHRPLLLVECETDSTGFVVVVRFGRNIFASWAVGIFPLSRGEQREVLGMLTGTKPLRRATTGARIIAMLLSVLLLGALVSVPAEAAAVPDVTGAWISKGLTVPTWHLMASGSGRSHLHATWGGAPGSGHEGLLGVFNGTLNGSAYAGDFVLTEGSVRVTGTMAFLIVNATHITISLTPAGSSTQTIYLSRPPKHSSIYEGNLSINLSYVANALPTAPPSGGGRCPAPIELAHLYGMFAAHRTDHVDGGGSIYARPRNTLCRVPNLDFAVNNIIVSVSGTTITAEFTVRASETSNTQPGQCQVPFTGTITATENDAVRAANGLTAASVKFGPWSRPCNAFNQTITNDISSVPADATDSTWVRVFIGCQGEGTGYSPRNCLAG
jgi:hypothetical protein